MNELAKIEDPYIILGVGRDATQEEIAKAFKAHAKRCHPDMNGGKRNDEFDRIKAAYDILEEPQKRAIYDRYGVSPDDDMALIHIEAENRLAMIFKKSIMEVPPSAFHMLDLISYIQATIDKNIEHHRGSIREINGTIDMLKQQREIMTKRLKAAAGTKNIFVVSLDALVEEGKQKLKEPEDHIKIFDLMALKLKAFTFDFDKPNFATGGFATSATTPGIGRHSFVVTNIVTP